MTDPTPHVSADELLWTGPADGAVLVLAHGAGAPMDSPFMERIAEALGERGVRVCRFEFPYMAERRRTGKKRGPNPAKTLRATWHEVVALAGGPDGLWIGGKSMGGRYATMVAEELGVRGTVCFGYPFHPAGQPDKLRTEHLETMTVPTLILQGERDPMGKREEVDGYRLSDQIEVVWSPDGNHDLMPRHKSGHTAKGNHQAAAEAAVRFVTGG